MATITATLGDGAGLKETHDQVRVDVHGGGGDHQPGGVGGGDSAKSNVENRPLNPRVRGEVYALTGGGDKLLSRELTGRLAGDEHNPLSGVVTGRLSDKLLQCSLAAADEEAAGQTQKEEPCHPLTYE